MKGFAYNDIYMTNIRFEVIILFKWKLYPKCMATIYKRIFNLELIGKDSISAKVPTVTECQLYPWPLYPKSKPTLFLLFRICSILMQRKNIIFSIFFKLLNLTDLLCRLL